MKEAIKKMRMNVRPMSLILLLIFTTICESYSQRLVYSGGQSIECFSDTNLFVNKLDSFQLKALSKRLKGTAMNAVFIDSNDICEAVWALKQDSSMRFLKSLVYYIQTAPIKFNNENLVLISANGVVWSSSENRRRAFMEKYKPVFYSNKDFFVQFVFDLKNKSLVMLYF